MKRILLFLVMMLFSVSLSYAISLDNYFYEESMGLGHQIVIV